jgi:hypothetical protein
MLGAAAVAIATLPGCAFVFSQGPPTPERQAKDTYFDCSDSWVPAIVDALMATLTGISAVASYDEPSSNPHAASAISAGLTVLFLTSAIYGITSVATCGSAKTARLARKQGETLLPPPYGMPPWGEPPPYWPPPVALYSAPAPAIAPKTPHESPVTPAEAPAPTPAPPLPASPIFKPAPPAAPLPPASL